MTAAVRTFVAALLASAALGCSSPTAIHGPDLSAAEIGDGSSMVLATDRWSFDGASGRVLTTPSFRIYTTQRESLVMDRLPGLLELALIEYRTAFGELPRPKRRLETYMMATRGQWARLTQRLMGDASPTYLRIKRGGYAAEARGVYFDIGPRDTLAVAAHEGWHQYTQAVFDQPLPVWMEEGVATYMEGFRWSAESGYRPVFMPWANLERYDQLASAARLGELMTLRELLDARPQDLIDSSGRATLTYYAQIWALTHFLQEGGRGRYREGFHQAVADAAGGKLSSTLRKSLGTNQARAAMMRRTGTAVFSTYIDPDLVEADKAFAAFIKRIVRPGSREIIAAGGSPAV